MSSALKRRGRIVSFRVSDEEYLNLCQATDAAGAHSISDFARHVTCHHSLVVSRTAAVAGAGSHGTHGNGNGNGATPTNGTSFSNGALSHAQTELLPAPAMVIEVTRLRERVEILSRQMQDVVRHLSTAAISPSL